MTPKEQARIDDLLGLVPRGRASVLDIGARDGSIARLLAGLFPSVTAADINAPAFRIPGVRALAADAVRLPFTSGSFDCVFCSEVLEHIPRVEEACREIARVARREILIGVPYRQDLRVGRTTCGACGRVNPAWGHVNSFDERRLESLFPSCSVVRRSYVGETREHTNPLSSRLMDLAGNPWGAYNQKEGCIFCSAALVPPPGQRPRASRLLSASADVLNRLQRPFVRPHANWIHVLFQKRGASTSP